MFTQAIWIEAEGEFSPLGNREKLSLFQDVVKRLGIQRLYLQVFRRGFAWFPTSNTDLAEAAAREDLLARIAEFCVGEDIELYAWVNIFNLGLSPSPTALSLLSSHELVDNFGTTTGGYPVSSPHFELDTPGRWFQPGSPAVHAYLNALIADLLRVQGVAGIHLDFIRYPYALPLRPYTGSSLGRDFGYGALTPVESEGLLKVTPNGGLYPLDEAASLVWDIIRRAHITSFVRDLRGRIGGRKLSCAVLAWPDRAYLNAFQDWRGWMLDQLCDEIVLMSYTGDTHLLRLLVRQALAFRSKKTALLSGVGVYKLSTGYDVQAQIAAAMEEKADGAVLFSYSNLMSNQRMLKELLKES